MDRYSFTGGDRYEVPASVGKRRRWGAFSSSVALHVLAGGILSIWQELDNAGLLRSHERVLEEEIRQARKTILYYPSIRRLPDVSPKSARRVTQEAKSIPDEQMIRTQAPRRTVNTDQFIRVPVPQIRQQPALPSPNIVVVQQAAVAPPPPPPPPPTPAPAPKKFVPPTAKNRAASPSPTIEAMAPPQQPAALTLPPPGGGQQSSVPNIPSNQRYVPPPPVAGSGKSPSKVEAAEAAPTLSASASGSPSGNSPMATTIIISAVPVPGAPPPKPEGNRNARIAVGGESGAGSNRASAPAGGVTAPGVVVRSTAPPGATGAPGGAVTTPPKPPTASPSGDVARVAPPNIVQSISVPQRPGARQLPPQVEAVFQGRVVYSTVVPTSNSQPDWVMWFAEPASPVQATGGRVMMRPPVPERATFPASLHGMPAKAWLKALVRKNGILAEVQFLDGGKAPQALTELVKWMFYPAVKNGQQVDVEAVVEVTWR